MYCRPNHTVTQYESNMYVDCMPILRSFKFPNADLATLDSLKGKKQKLKYTNIIEQCMQLRQVMESLDKVSNAHARREKLKVILEEGIRLRAEVDAMHDENTTNL